MKKTCLIQVFAKAPVAGTCKTRLAPSTGYRGAARIQHELIHLSVDKAAAFSPNTELWCAPSCSHPAFALCSRRHGIPRRQQLGNDLGQRMAGAIGQGLRCADQVILIGTDCPALTTEHLASASGQLSGDKDFVFIPAEDGGYVLVGARINEPRVFTGIDWGTSTVMQATKRRLQRLGVNYGLMPALWDVDHPEDLKRWKNDAHVINMKQ